MMLNLNPKRALLKLLYRCIAFSIILYVPLSHADENSEFHPDRILVKFKSIESANSAEAERFFSENVFSVVKRLERVGIALVKIDLSQTNVQKAIALMNKQDRLIEYAEPDFKRQAFATPNDPSFSQLWGLNNIGQTGGTTDADIDAPEAWDSTIGDESIVVGVIDSGVDYTHPDLAANMWVNPIEAAGVPGIDDDTNGYIDDFYGIDTVNGDADPMDDNGHGTHVAGTIAAVGDNGIGISGVTWNSKIMALKFLSSSGIGFTSGAIELLNYSLIMKQNYGVNIKITNNSWGGGGYSQALYDSIAAHSAANILFAAAAGNDSTNTDLFPQYPQGYDVANVISVGATNANDTAAFFSNFGVQSVDISAPGEQIYSTTPSNTYSSYSGTSMASPHVAGAAALLLASDPNLTAVELKNSLMQSADPVSALVGQNAVAGRLNIANAISCDSLVFEPVVSLNDNFTALLDQSNVLTGQIRACGSPGETSLSISFSNGQPTLTAKDDGIFPDSLAGDGVFSAEWIPSPVGPAELTWNFLVGDDSAEVETSGTIIDPGFYTVDDAADYDWIDISGTGNQVFLGDDSNFWPVRFPFSLYGANYTSLAIQSNGALTFDNATLSYVNSTLPVANDSNGLIAVFWDDLNPSIGGSIYYEVQDDVLIVQWDNIPHYGGQPDGVSFQLILDASDGSIKMQYEDTVFAGDQGAYDNGLSSTIGLQSSSQFNISQQYSYNEPVVTQGSAILWTLGSVISPTPDVNLISSCLGGTGRVDLNIVNTQTASSVYRFEFGNLSAREVTVDFEDWGRLQITGRLPNTYPAVVQRDGVEILNTNVTIDCSSALPPVSVPEVSIINACRGSTFNKGQVFFQLVNPTTSPRHYVIEFENLPNRSTTAAGFGQAIRGTTGRPDGTYTYTVRSGSADIDTGQVTVDCN